MVLLIGGGGGGMALWIGGSCMALLIGGGGGIVLLIGAAAWHCSEVVAMAGINWSNNTVAIRRWLRNISICQWSFTLTYRMPTASFQDVHSKLMMFSK